MLNPHGLHKVYKYSTMGIKVVSKQLGNNDQWIDFPCILGQMMGGMQVVAKSMMVIVPTMTSVNQRACTHFIIF